jgi:hypothetical protein
MLTDLQVHVFRPLEIFHEPETVSLLVAPDTLETRSVPEGAKGILPVPLIAESKTLKHVTTGESDE